MRIWKRLNMMNLPSGILKPGAYEIQAIRSHDTEWKKSNELNFLRIYLDDMIWEKKPKFRYRKVK